MLPVWTAKSKQEKEYGDWEWVSFVDSIERRSCQEGESRGADGSSDVTRASKGAWGA